MPMTAGSERRQFQRIRFDAPVILEQDGRTWTSLVLDVSLRGILTNDEVEFDRKRPVNISIELSHDAHINMVAEWAHSENSCAGFCWIQLDVDSLSHLRRLLELNTGNEDVLNRELAQLSGL